MLSFKPYLNQNYEKIKQKCLQSKSLFEDELFPANDKSLYHFNTPEKNILWKRPNEIVDNPQFIVDSIAPDDLDQGQIGDCWLISSCAAVATVPEYINNVVPKGQSFNKSDYAGIFHFRLWRSGEWIDIVIDDYLPVDAESGALVYCNNKQDTNEMFGPLLEKAFAKLNSCYEFLDGGDPSEAMIDMTGGVHETFKVKSEENDGAIKIEKAKLWEVVYKSFCMKSLSSASIDVGNSAQEAILANGLVLGHAYTVETAIEIYSSKNNGVYDAIRTSFNQKINTKTIKLLKLRNPWGQTNSWSGKWCPNSEEWAKIDNGIKKKLKYDQQANGHFYISFTDFYFSFDRLQFVYVNFNAFYSNSDANIDYKWEIRQFKGAWIPGENAGGCGNDDMNYYWKNPQYSIALTAESSKDDDKISLIVSLIQTEQVRKRAETNGSYENSNEAISFRIYQVSVKSLVSRYSEDQLTEVGNLDIYLAEKEVSKRFDLPPGDYVIIPSLFEKDKPMQFVLRLFMESSNHLSEDNSGITAQIEASEVNNNYSKTNKQESWQEESNIINEAEHYQKYDNSEQNTVQAVQASNAGCSICQIL